MKQDRANKKETLMQITLLFDQLISETRKSGYYNYIGMQYYYDTIAKKLGYSPETIRVYILEYNKRKRNNVKRAKKEDK